ncbi:hypothetical protein BHE90_009554 [Fusarium euwallaceae]|uniref:Uncharacterized protein n=2 Tax=Fusarium solani species complex TaxID=232080 RepID=A0A430LJR2_9HYPO|nr:hypothetical protein CDV31_013704 [Fusarium ambrosium]RTE75975.1 hypothetical protein BHE90_009554 [Fusarium euwallaceae]
MSIVSESAASQCYCYPLPETTPQLTPTLIRHPVPLETPATSIRNVPEADIDRFSALVWQTATPSSSDINTPPAWAGSNLSRTPWAPTQLPTEAPVETSSASNGRKMGGFLWFTILSIFVHLL